jgi:hypothetical protein
VQDGGGHEQRAVARIEPAGRFDLGQFVRGRNIQPQRLFRERFLRLGGFEQIDPVSALGQSLDVAGVEGRRGAVRTEEAEHCPC